ncbi:MAG: hypothetical protein LBV59_09700 [Sphingobacterium sp.]|jgi:hypothetical protein|uniref:hypothetical protein n=1 Tax=Sphingobacterium sp. TaxID=341027 RepID=UPI00283CF69A|nr:hypothetical protein [Sphingobacterium sp.]MDR3008195.1 hypothetical protein [Sphingobacterium sp.]
MKVRFLIPFLFFIIACQGNDQKQVPVKIQKQAFDYTVVADDYAEILDAIIDYNSISSDVAKTNKPTAYIHKWFIKDSLYNAYDKDLMPGGLRIQKLLGLVGHSQQDSTGYLKQVKGKDTVFIPLQIKKKYNVAYHKKTEMTEQFPSRYTFHLPIMSHDRKKAFVSLDYVCGALCGQGYDFILEKINGKWKVIKRDYTWIS